MLCLLLVDVLLQLLLRRSSRRKCRSRRILGRGTSPSSASNMFTCSCSLPRAFRNRCAPTDDVVDSTDRSLIKDTSNMMMKIGQQRSKVEWPRVHLRLDEQTSETDHFYFHMYK
mmetsp:Transcript_5499/g.13754  ORF Transcript_5499/g.13754 Transcript_5499/m.13754 type:complete len:114 (-) Transcript_5499:216-557(-)